MFARFRIGNGQTTAFSQRQWAPTLTSHDPNPPITIENPPPVTGVQQQLPMLGVGS